MSFRTRKDKILKEKKKKEEVEDARQNREAELQRLITKDESFSQSVVQYKQSMRQLAVRLL
jgi:hypothetical protein